MPGAGRRRRRRKRSIANATSLAVFKLIHVTLFSLETDAILMYSTTLCVYTQLGLELGSSQLEDVCQLNRFCRAVGTSAGPITAAFWR